MNLGNIKAYLATIFTDSTLGADIDKILPKTQAEIDRLIRLRVQDEVTILGTSAWSDGGDFNHARYQLPEGFLEPRFLQKSGDNLAFQLPTEFFSGSNYDLNVYTIQGEFVYPSPEPKQDDSYTFGYIKKLDPLGNDLATNPLSDQAPDVYIFSLAKEIASMLRRPDAVQEYESKFMSAVRQLKISENRSKSDARVGQFKYRSGTLRLGNQW